MQRVIDFIQASELQYFSTIGLDGKPKVRPFQMMFNEGGKLIYCTGAHKEVVKELNANPFVEVCISSTECWVRIQGEVSWFDSYQTRKKIIAHSDLVASIYHDASNPELKTFFLKNASAVLMDFSGKQPEVITLT